MVNGIMSRVLEKAHILKMWALALLEITFFLSMTSKRRVVISSAAEFDGAQTRMRVDLPTGSQI